MLYAITIKYIQTAEQIKQHLESHKAWLENYIHTGAILVAGPLESNIGGFILAFGKQLSVIQEMVENDPFYIHQLVTFDIQAFDPKIGASSFPEQWAPEAKRL
ncbi:YciI family protein [Methylophilus sp. 5]|uniref:YciI family protein n=1 Tax=Methylophilus sp. 5 TaxID=1112274 RepID=UPI000491753A|nr:YciI family protein [Methylophilus sp. 5]